MPATFPPLDVEVLTGLRNGEEPALERIFRERYAPLLDEGTSVLHDGSLAAVTVEKVFVRAWKERASFTTVEELDAFLRKATHDAALVRQSRRAGLHHHFDAHAPTHAHDEGPKPAPSVDAAWSQVAAALHAPVDTVDPTTRAKHARHEAAEHLGSVGKSGPWLVPTLIIGVVLLAVAAAGWWFTRSSAATAAESAIASSSAHALATSTGQLGQITLDDGTTARLGADSRIRVPAGFGEKFRAIGLEGAAMFTVAPGQPLTFDVRTRDAWIKATGTVFAVRAYPNEEAVTVRVKEGTVTVQRGDETRTLAAGSALSITKDGTITEPTAAALDEALAWTDGFMSLHQRPLRDALAEVSRWYGLTMFVRDSSLLTRTVTMRAPLESNREMIAALEKGGGLVFGYEGKNMTLSDTLPTPPAKGARKK